VSGTARNRETLAHFEASYPERFQALTLDVNNWQDIRTAVASAETYWDGLDVIVNNAGYGLEGALEELTEEQIRQQMETNFFGLVGVVQACLPRLRTRTEGSWIFNIASIAGLRGMRGLSLYNASKFAVVGLSEALAQELKPFGIRVVSVEPGPYRTDWAGRSMMASEALRNQDPESPYQELNTYLHDLFATISGNQPGDPSQLAAVLVDTVEYNAPNPPVHFLFGDPGIEAYTKHHARLADPTFMKHYPHDKRTYS
jgi:NAD(P)-dependent dehydrogenase (short-subunit alcohol dehydrogenase family)